MPAFKHEPTIRRPKRLLALINTSSKRVGYKINIKNSAAFLYPQKKLLKKSGKQFHHNSLKK
jgi:hypothetical protein